VPQPPDPYALHDAELARLRQEQAAALKPAAPTSTKPARSKPTSEKPASDKPTSSRPARIRSENRQEVADGTSGVVGGTTGFIYELGALIFGIGWFVAKGAVNLGTKLAVGMFRAAHWVMSEITGGD
jgi:hypothetical protein